MSYQEDRAQRLRQEASATNIQHNTAPEEKDEEHVSVLHEGLAHKPRVP